MSVQAIPAGYHSVTAYLIVRNAAAAINYYIQAFGATETLRLMTPEGKIGHAEIRIGDSPVMLADEHPDMGFHSPASLGGSASGILIYVEDADEVFDRAIEAGGKVLRPVMDQFYGDRSGVLADPFGHMWTVATHIEDVSEPEMQQRNQAYFEQQE